MKTEYEQLADWEIEAVKEYLRYIEFPFSDPDTIINFYGTLNFQGWFAWKMIKELAAKIWEKLWQD